MLYLGAFFTFRRLTLHSPGHLSTRLAGYSSTVACGSDHEKKTCPTNLGNNRTRKS